MENDLPVVITAEEEVQADIARYERESFVDCMDVIPAPRKLDMGLINHKEGIISWPVTLYVVSI